MTEDEEKRDKIALNRVIYWAANVAQSAAIVEGNANDVRFWVDRVLTKRPFETLAEDQLDRAERAVTNALETIRLARTRYLALPQEEKVS